MTSARQILKDRRLRNAGLAAAIVAAHLGVFAVIGRAQPNPPVVLQPIIEVLLFRPTPPPPPPPPPEVDPAPTQGGGAPAAPSRVHVPPPPARPTPPELPAPVVQAPEPDPIVVGVAPVASPTPGFGQGGEGTGAGTGVGAGAGPGSGGIGPRIIRGASPREIFDGMPPAVRRGRVPVEARVNCEIGLNLRLSACRVVEETPAGLDVGPAALRIAERHFRFEPPRDAAGRAVAGARVTVTVSIYGDRR